MQHQNCMYIYKKQKCFFNLVSHLWCVTLFDLRLSCYLIWRNRTLVTLLLQVVVTYSLGSFYRFWVFVKWVTLASRVTFFELSCVQGSQRSSDKYCLATQLFSRKQRSDAFYVAWLCKYHSWFSLFHETLCYSNQLHSFRKPSWILPKCGTCKINLLVFQWSYRLQT